MDRAAEAPPPRTEAPPPRRTRDGASKADPPKPLGRKAKWLRGKGGEEEEESTFEAGNLDLLAQEEGESGACLACRGDA